MRFISARYFVYPAAILYIHPSSAPEPERLVSEFISEEEQSGTDGWRVLSACAGFVVVLVRDVTGAMSQQRRQWHTPAGGGGAGGERGHMETRDA